MFESVDHAVNHGVAQPRDARLAAARTALKSAEARIGAARHGGERSPLPLAPALGALFPHGLRRGQVVSVTGSTSLMLALAGEASRSGSWTAIIGMPHVGVVAASRRGIELARLALIPHPGAHAAGVAGECIDGMDVVMLGRRLALSDADRRRLAARARERGSVLVAAGDWPGAHVSLVVESARWSGLGTGDGRLRDREAVIAVSGRSVGAVRRVAVVLDADSNSADSSSNPSIALWRPGVRSVLAPGEVA